MFLVLSSWLVSLTSVLVGWYRLRRLRRQAAADGARAIEAWLGARGWLKGPTPESQSIPPEDAEAQELLEQIERLEEPLDRALAVGRHAEWLSRELRVGRSIPYAAARISLSSATLSSLVLIALSSGNPLSCAWEVGAALLPGVATVALLRRLVAEESRLAKSRCERWLSLGLRLSRQGTTLGVDLSDRDR